MSRGGKNIRGANNRKPRRILDGSLMIEEGENDQAIAGLT
jgi:hypothetical protein